MTDENIDVGNVNSQNISNENYANNDQSNNVTEKMIPASRMNEIVHERTRQASQSAYERAKREFEDQQSRQSNNSVNSIGGIKQLSEDQIRQIARDESSRSYEQKIDDLKRQQVQGQIENLAKEFMGKISSEKDYYPELTNKIDDIGDLGQLIYYINETDSVPGIVDDLLKPGNGHKVAALFTLAERSPQMLRRELKSMADSIKTNKSARNTPNVNEPLRQPNHSANALDSGSAYTYDSLKNADWLRV